MAADKTAGVKTEPCKILNFNINQGGILQPIQKGSGLLDKDSDLQTNKEKQIYINTIYFLGNSQLALDLEQRVMHLSRDEALRRPRHYPGTGGNYSGEM